MGWEGGGKEAQEGGDIYIYIYIHTHIYIYIIMIELSCCMAETNTTL